MLQIPQDSLHTGRAGELRTEKDCKHWMELISAETTIERRNKLGAQYGLHPVVCALWGFNFADNQDEHYASIVSPYCAFSYEGMHNDDLGVFLYMIDAIGAIIDTYHHDDEAWTKAKTSALLKKLNERMRLCPRAVDFNLPWCGGSYFPDHTRVQAREHKLVLQIVAFLTNGLDDPSSEDLTELFAL